MKTDMYLALFILINLFGIVLFFIIKAYLRKRNLYKLYQLRDEVCKQVLEEKLDEKSDSVNFIILIKTYYNNLMKGYWPKVSKKKFD